jgi:predicted transcriptional regulator
MHQENLKIKNKKTSYRTQMHSLGDVLDVIKGGGREGVIVSVIGRRANLSHYPVLKKCDLLIDAGLIVCSMANQNKIFTITEKGLRFSQEYDAFKKLVESLNLRY